MKTEIENVPNEVSKYGFFLFADFEHSINFLSGPDLGPKFEFWIQNEEN